MNNIRFVNHVNFEKMLDELFSFEKEMNYTEPIHDIIENEDKFIVDLHFAGIDKEDISIDVDDDTLTIEAERIAPEDVNFIHKQSYAGKYKKVFKLSEIIDKKKIDASFLNGVLTLKIPKTKESKKKKFSVEID